MSPIRRRPERALTWVGIVAAVGIGCAAGLTLPAKDATLVTIIAWGVTVLAARWILFPPTSEPAPRPAPPLASEATVRLAAQLGDDKDLPDAFTDGDKKWLLSNGMPLEERPSPADGV